MLDNKFYKIEAFPCKANKWYSCQTINFIIEPDTEYRKLHKSKGINPVIEPSYLYAELYDETFFTDIISESLSHTKSLIVSIRMFDVISQYIEWEDFLVFDVMVKCRDEMRVYKMIYPTKTSNIDYLDFDKTKFYIERRHYENKIPTSIKNIREYHLKRLHVNAGGGTVFAVNHKLFFTSNVIKGGLIYLTYDYPHFFISVELRREIKKNAFTGFVIAEEGYMFINQ